ncbi:sensor histidine kinase [Jatrophihabitans fulvus]
MVTGMRRLQLRIERSCERMGATYPWWIPAFTTLATVAIAVASWAQRGAVNAPVSVQLATVLTVSPLVLWCLTARMLMPLVESATTLVAVALFLTDPASPDLAPLLLLIAAGELAAVLGVAVALTAAAVDVGVLVVAAALDHLDNLGVYAIGVVLAAQVGIALRWQMRALRAERENTAHAQERAMLAERQRLAREVHDVVGHSLSINLLHVTAARHALQQHADIADAVESLSEAERVGRAAMRDLRRTVAVLAAGPSEAHALPGAADIPELVERSRAAGLDVTIDSTGELGALGPSAGLGLFRIVQESLGNIARHAPNARATVTVDETPDGLRLEIVNTLPDGPREPSAGGSGLPGMAARAEQLGADLRAGVEGVEGARWVVELTVPRRARVGVAP